MLRITTKTATNLSCRCLHSRTGNHSNHFNIESICSEDNIRRCIKSMQSMQPQVKLSQKQHDTEAAVLIPLCTHNDELSLLYTVRSAKLSKHVRQVSFPGGLRDADESWENCAIRETEEEIGIPNEQIQIYGTGRMIVPARPPSIMPIVGFVNRFDIRSLKLNSDEVESCFTVPLRELCRNENKRHTQFKGGYCVPTFIGAEKRIWGITGLITHLFLTALLPKDIYSHPMKFVSKYRPVPS